MGCNLDLWKRQGQLHLAKRPIAIGNGAAYVDEVKLQWWWHPHKVSRRTTPRLADVITARFGGDSALLVSSAASGGSPSYLAARSTPPAL